MLDTALLVAHLQQHTWQVDAFLAGEQWCLPQAPPPKQHDRHGLPAGLRSVLHHQFAADQAQLHGDTQNRQALPRPFIVRPKRQPRAQPQQQQQQQQRQQPPGSQQLGACGTGAGCRTAPPSCCPAVNTGLQQQEPGLDAGGSTAAASQLATSDSLMSQLPPVCSSRSPCGSSIASSRAVAASSSSCCSSTPDCDLPRPSSCLSPPSSPRCSSSSSGRADSQQGDGAPPSSCSQPEQQPMQQQGQGQLGSGTGFSAQGPDDLEQEKKAVRKRLAELQQAGPAAAVDDAPVKATAAAMAAAARVRGELLQEAAHFERVKWTQACRPMLLATLACFAGLILMRCGSALLPPRLLCGLLLALPCLLAGVMARLGPLHFRRGALEAAFQGSCQGRQLLVDVLFNNGWCLLAVCSVVRFSCSSATAHSGGLGASAPRGLSWLLSCSSTPLLVLLLSPVMGSVALLVAAPQAYKQWREQLLLGCRVAMIGCLMGLPGASESLQPSGLLLLLAALHALVMACLMVRFSAFLPMQLMHVLALLHRSPGGAGYAVQLVGFGLWLPCLLLFHFEVLARCAFLASRVGWGKQQLGPKAA